MAQDFRNVVARSQGTSAAAILTGGNYDAVMAFVLLIFSRLQ